MLQAGLDVGNGYVKALVKNPDADRKAEAVDMPSATSVITSSADVRISDPAAVEREFSDIWNCLEISVDSPLAADRNVRLYTGRRAILSGKALQEFNLHEGRRSKSENELSGVLVLSVLAGKALLDFYRREHRVPGKNETLSVTAKIALSLPIAEYRTGRDRVVRGYTSQKHTVTVYNFQDPVRIEIHIAEAEVAPEGASAQFAIASKGEKFMAALVKNMTKNGIRIPDGITVRDIMAATGLAGVDIGEGTVNFPIYHGLKFNADTSQTFNKGYGSVMDEALSQLSQQGRPFDSRKKLVEWLLEAKDRPLQRSRYESAMEVVRREIDIFTTEIIRQFSVVLERSGAFIEVIYVFGGGATPVQESLYPKLVRTVQRSFGENAFVPVLYLDSSYSRFLNRDGLYLLASSGGEKSVTDLPPVPAQ